MSSLDLVAIGHALVDIRFIVSGFPGPDQETEILEEARGSGGSAVNVAIDAAKLGGKSGIISKIGFDPFGKIIFEELWNEGIDVRGVRISPTGSTGFSIVTIDTRGEIILYSCKGVAESLEPQEIPSDVIRDSKSIHIASLRLDTSLRSAQIARESGILTSWDPGRKMAKMGLDKASPLLEYIDVVFLNRLEAKLMTGKEPAEAAKLIASRGPKWVIVKLGGEGALLYDNGKLHRIPPYTPPRIIDTTGAGDAFAAATLIKIIKGYDVLEAVNYAAAVAALKISRLGSHNLPSLNEIEEFIRNKSY